MKFIFLLLFGLFMFGSPVLAQDSPKKTDATKSSKRFVAPTYSKGKQALYKEIFGSGKFKIPKDMKKQVTMDTKVWVRLLISEDGDLVDSEIVDALSPDMEEKLVSNIEKLKGEFRSAKKTGVPVEAWLTLSLRLKKGSF